MCKIQNQILVDIQSAINSIKIAVSWLTDPLIIDTLIDKTKKGVSVKIVTSSDEWNILRFEKFQLLQKLGATVNKNGSPDVFEPGFMHCKFYIIDDILARGGSYNFTSNATFQFNQLKTISNETEFQETLIEFDELLKESVDFFTDIKQPQKIKAELDAIERKGVTPERRKELELAIKLKKLDENKIQSVEQKFEVPKSSSKTNIKEWIVTKCEKTSDGLAYKLNVYWLNVDRVPLNATIRRYPNGFTEEEIKTGNAKVFTSNYIIEHKEFINAKGDKIFYRELSSEDWT